MAEGATTTDRRIYSVSGLNRAVRALLEDGFAMVWLEGEVSNLARPASGHLYFSLKDDQAQVRCALFRNRAAGARIALTNGQQVVVLARVTLYEPRGDYQLIVEQVEDAGEGALRRAFEVLKAKLAAEGLFDTASKRPLPRLPRRIGVITSPSGAAVRDVLSVLRRRFPSIAVMIYPVPVQGTDAAPRITRALQLAGTRADCDVLLLVRGGGSLEDLWPFNDEAVARAIRACPIPVVAGVGHEVDVTIADFAADVRAATPSAAAELVSPDRAEWMQLRATLQARLVRAIHARLERLQLQLGHVGGRLDRAHPGRQLQLRAQRLDELGQDLERLIGNHLNRDSQRLGGLSARLRAVSPGHRLEWLRERAAALMQRLQRATRMDLERRRDRLAAAARALQTVSPLATLGRGYAIVYGQDGTILRDASAVRVGESVRAELARGVLECRVERTHPLEGEPDPGSPDPAWNP